jgi:hypothetical protein
MIHQFADNLRRGVPAPGEQEGTVRSADMVRRVLTSLGAMLAFAMSRGLVAQAVAHGRRTSDKRRKTKLEVGVDIPSPADIATFIGSLEE